MEEPASNVEITDPSPEGSHGSESSASGTFKPLFTTATDEISSKPMQTNAEASLGQSDSMIIQSNNVSTAGFVGDSSTNVPETTNNSTANKMPPISSEVQSNEDQKKTDSTAGDTKGFASEFHKFLQEENINCGIHSEESSLQMETEPGAMTYTNTKPSNFPSSNMDDTSNSSWYKIDNDKDNTETSINMSLQQDEASNLSAAGSGVYSNIGDTASLQEQASNMDESSNISMPDENSVAAYSGHQPVFDESANMNPPSNSTFLRPDTPNSEKDKNAGDSNSPVKKPSRRGTLQIAADDASEHGHGLTASDIYEYQWPREPDADFYILQEQISIYLDVKSFKRKYSELFRRICDKHEKDFLRDKGVVSETQSDLGLTALKADEVHDLMSRDYPAKYKEFIKVLHDREKQRMADKMKELNTIKMTKDKMVEFTKKAMKSVSDWNRNMLKERNEQRRAYFDMQTFTIQYPQNKHRKLDSSQTKVDAYPLAIIPGQFQDDYKTYTMEELKSFPLNTALVGPPKTLDPAQEEPDQESGSESSSSSESEEEEEAADSVVPDKPATRDPSKEKSQEPVVKTENLCRICKDEPEEKQRHHENDDVISCSECKSIGHPTCLDLTEEMMKVIKTYPWQCMECKTCVQCMDPYDEDKMLFCDKCDRGYHTFCVGLKSLPTGQWDCFSCRGDTTPIKPLPKPTPKSKRGRKPRDPNTPRRPPGRPRKDQSKIEVLRNAGEPMVKLEDIAASNSGPDAIEYKESKRDARMAARANKELNKDAGKDGAVNNGAVKDADGSKENGKDCKGGNDGKETEEDKEAKDLKQEAIDEGSKDVPDEKGE